MATPLSTLLSWAVSRWKPTHEQIQAWMNSFRHMDDPITIDDLETTLKQKINNAGSGAAYQTGTQRFPVTAASQTDFTPDIDITLLPLNKVCVTNSVRVTWQRVGNKVVLDDAAHAGDVVYIDVI